MPVLRCTELRTLLAAQRFRLSLSLSRIYLPSNSSPAVVRMVSTKTIPVCDADSLKDGEMSVALIADAIWARRPSYMSCSVHLPNLQERSRIWKWKGFVVQDRR